MRFASAMQHVHFPFNQKPVHHKRIADGARYGISLFLLLSFSLSLYICVCVSHLVYSMCWRTKTRKTRCRHIFFLSFVHVYFFHININIAYLFIYFFFLCATFSDGNGVFVPAKKKPGIMLLYAFRWSDAAIVAFNFKKYLLDEIWYQRGYTTYGNEIKIQFHAAVLPCCPSYVIASTMFIMFWTISQCLSSSKCCSFERWNVVDVKIRSFDQNRCI